MGWARLPVIMLAWCHHWHWVWCEDSGLPAAAHTGPRSQRPEPEPERSELPGTGPRPGGGGQGLLQPSGRPAWPAWAQVMSRVVVAVVTRLQRLPAERERDRGGERSPRPVTLQATPVRAGLDPCGPHSLTPTTLFVTLQRISCNIFLPAEIKQSEVRVISSSHLQDAKDNNPQSHPHFLFYPSWIRKDRQYYKTKLQMLKYAIIIYFVNSFDESFVLSNDATSETIQFLFPLKRFNLKLLLHRPQFLLLGLFYLKSRENFLWAQ